MENLLIIFRSLGPGRIMAMLFGIAAIVSIAGTVIQNVNKPGMALLYGGLTAQEVNEIAGILDTQNIEYDIRNEEAVYIPSDKVGQMRLKVAGEGLVGGSSAGYEIFDKSSSFGTTSFVQNLNAKRALEGELARTINTLPSVKSSRVHLVLPKRTAFSRQTTPPSASVTLNMGNRILDETQISSIAQMVASAVPNLTIKNITVIDQRGSMLFDGKKHDNVMAGMTGQLQRQIEKTYESKLTTMLEKVTGPGRADVKVNAVIGLDRVEEQSEIFDPTRQAVRSEQRSEVTNTAQGSSNSGAAGLAGNTPGGGNTGSGSSNNESGSRAEETINYEITRTIRNLKREAGKIEKLSVAVLVEGKYEGDNKETYIPYNDEDLARFKKLVQTSIGYNEERGDTVEVIDMPFSQPEEPVAVEAPMFGKEDIISLVQYTLLVIGGIAIALFIVKPGLKVLTDSSGATIQRHVEEALAKVGPIAGDTAAGNVVNGGEDEMVDMDKVEGRVRQSTVKKVNEIIDQHPEETLTVVRNWMAGNDAKTNES